MTPQVELLRQVRDKQVMTTFAGSQFMQIFHRFYYSFSPQVAEIVSFDPFYAGLTRAALTPLLQILTLLRGRTQAEIVLFGLAVSTLIGLAYLSIPLTSIDILLKVLRATAKRMMITLPKMTKIGIMLYRSGEELVG